MAGAGTPRNIVRSQSVHSQSMRSQSVRLLSRFNTISKRIQRDGQPEVVNFDFESFTPRPRLLSLESLMSFGLGSDVCGGTISEVPCGNQIEGSRTQRRCTKRGSLICPRKGWQPSWILENRDPKFISTVAWSPLSEEHHCYPAMDILQLGHNEGILDAANMDFKLCFTACSDIRNLVKTVNSLPKDYSGYCSILINDTDALSLNRSLVILFALLSPGPSIDEAAELVTHLMYSSFLTPQAAGYVQSCVDYIYASDPCDSKMSFRVKLPTRGTGSSICSTQAVVGPRQVLEMFTDHWSADDAAKVMKRSLDMDTGGDTWDLFMSKLMPSHRLSFNAYRESGILMPFSMNTTRFTQPNRLLFSPEGKWLGTLNPLQGWDMNPTLLSGERHGADPADLCGCLFFHVKNQLREFARRVKDLNVDILLTQFDPKILSKGLSSGALGFERVSDGGERAMLFDRVHTEDLVERVGLKECLADWAPLLNPRNPCSSLLMCAGSRKLSTTWDTSPKRNPRAALATIIRKCSGWVVHPKLKKSFSLGLRSPKLLRLIESLDAFYDHDEALSELLENPEIDLMAESFGVYLRRQNCVHPKRFGVPLEAPDHQLPSMNRDEFYQLATLCAVNFSVRFIEFARVGMTGGVDHEDIDSETLSYSCCS
ncbi:hypothetical protein Moror_582 [Moniliophthora roreri MCA 2997]|uniref:DUF4470 domain-containing protein n=1 Tax=Moniliophthora roreri (strain MCA 2997) TaxID=1381753 RepID=V2WX26_MONRO|nr:hypothetical protein Moror_582 [Moniliophthora roreri MCA 2997]